jgi:GTP 3',8-cyclase
MFDTQDFHLRIFLESHCNFRCVYCNPDAERQEDRVISNEEIIDFINVASQVGIRRIHYSGGEPTLRKGLPQIIESASRLGFIEQSMTTNGLLLGCNIDAYSSAGLQRVNISIDSLKRERFHSLTGKDCLKDVLSAIDKAVECFGETKINVVVLKTNIDEIPDFLEFSHKYSGKVVCRFIELQTNQPIFFQADRINHLHVTHEEIISIVSSYGEQVPAFIAGKNPNCSYFAIPNTKARFGIIANHSRGYPCGGCKKVRLSPYGDVGVCITAEGINIRSTTTARKKEILLSQINYRQKLDEVHPNRLHLSKDFGFWRWGDLNPSNGTRPIPMNSITSKGE